MAVGSFSSQPKTLLGVVLGLLLWGVVYTHLELASRALVSAIGLQLDTRTGEAVAYFFYDTPKVFMLLTLVVFAMGVVRSYFSPARTRALLTGKREGIGNVVAASLGILTPFCSCSAVPLFIGFVSAGVPLGVTFSFLIAAPMVNEIALGLLFGLVGWKIALAYLGFGLGIAIVAGWVMGRLHLEGWLEEWVRYARGDDFPTGSPVLSFQERLKEGGAAVHDILSKVWLWMVLGIAVGALIHGYAPAQLLASVMGRGAWWAVPVSVLIGVPMYSNAAGIIPVVEALIGKGAALGTVLAFMMSVTALSLPEAIILRKVLSLRLIIVYFGIVSCGILGVGYLFNALM